MAADTKLTLPATRSLMVRIREACANLRMTPIAFIEYAVEQELNRQEIIRVKDEIAIQEIDRHILEDGQSLSVEVGGLADADGHATICQMCLREFRSPVAGVEGPIFCNECLSMARGGDFSKVQIGP